MQIHLKTLGCRLNEAELENWASAFLADGHSLTEHPEQADLIVINTCAVTSEAVKKSRQLIRRSHRHNPKAKLVVSGCFATLTPELKDEIAVIDMLVPNRDKERLVDRVKHELSLESMPAVATEAEAAPLFKRGRNRAFVKVQDGCRYRCTFCIVTVARGREHSRPINHIVDQINRLHGQGVKEAVLTGVHVGGYGSDIGTELYTLLQAILSDTDIPRLRLASVEPWDLPDNFFGLFDDPRLMPHMHLPLQSGCDTVLRRMARRCQTADFERLINHARARVPDFNVTTDIIVGFPGETEREWLTSLAFIEKIGFSHIHIFPYSVRQGTKAASMSGQIPPALIKMRCHQLYALSERLRSNYLRKHVGREFPVLFEKSYKGGNGNRFSYSGYTTNYLRIQLNTSRALSLDNEIRDVRIRSLSEDSQSLLADLGTDLSLSPLICLSVPA
ncbi:MAG: tRNA (N(6)-L-threonylcarbamoyladenosine(37)-C(2))-methylthiotransferase MtaB [Gammaproteobacteria bacterium]